MEKKNEMRISLRNKLTKTGSMKIRGAFSHITMLLVLMLLFVAALFAFPLKAEAAATIVLGGTDISDKNTGQWINYGSGQYMLSGDRKTLSLKNINVSKNGYHALYAGDGDIKIVLYGNNTLKSTNFRHTLYLDNAEISGSGQLIVEGSDMSLVADELKVSSGTIISKATDADATCIAITDFQMTGGELSTSRTTTAEADKYDSEFLVTGDMIMEGGILETGNIYAGNSGCTTIQSGGKIIADNIEGNNSLVISGGEMIANNEIRYSISFEGDITIEGDNTSVTAGNIFVSRNLAVSQGAAVEAGKIYAGNNITKKGTGTVKVDGGNDNAIEAKGTLSVQGGTVEAYNNDSSYYPLTAGSLFITNGTLKATNKYSYGESAKISGDLIISGGFFISNYEVDVYGELKQEGGECSTGGNLDVNGNISSSGSITAHKIISGKSITVSKDGSLHAAFHINPEKDLINKGGSVISDGSIYIKGNLNQTGGKTTALGKYKYGTCDKAITVIGTAEVTGGELSGTVEGEGSSYTSYAICAEKLRISGGEITGINKGEGNGIYAKENIEASGGKLTGSSGKGYGIRLQSDDSDTAILRVSGNSAVKGEAGSGYGIMSPAISADGGTVNGTIINMGESGISCDNLKVTGTADISGKAYYTGTSVSDSGTGVTVNESLSVSGGSLKGIVSGEGSRGQGLYAGSLNLEDGTIQAETQSTASVYGYPANATAYIAGKMKMTGGKLICKSLAPGRTGFTVHKSESDIADDIWMSTPSDGYMGLWDNTWINQKKVDGYAANEVVLQKADSISVRTKPASQLYEGDCFKPSGLVLTVKYADGSTADLSYNDVHKDMFTFNYAGNQPLTAGDKTLDITCLTKTVGTTVKVKSLGAPVLSGTAGITSNELRWTAADGAEKYRIFAGIAGSGRSNWIADTTDTKFTHSGVSPAVSTEYTVYASRTSNAGETVEKASSTLTLTTYLSAPEIELTSAGYDSADLVWDAVAGAEAYEVYRNAGAASAAFERIATVTDTSLNDTGLDTGTKYTYYVTAINRSSDVSGGESNRVSFTPEFTGSTVLEAVNNGEGYDLSWDAVAGATAYEVYRGEGEITDAEQLTLLYETASTAYTDEEADPYSVYSYMVKPKRDIGSRVFYADSSNIAAGEAMERPPEPEPKPEPIPPAPQIVTPTTDDPAGTVYNLLQAKATKAAKTYVKIGWKAVPGAKFYMVYGNKCGNQNRYMKLTTTDATSMIYDTVAGSKIRKGTYYKFLIYAIDSNNEVISTSKTIHVATAGGKVGNDRKVITAAKKNKVSLKKGGKFKLRAKAVPASKKLKVKRHRRIAYESSDPKVAAVTSKGVIKGTGKGKCYVYAYTQNGVCARIRVSVH